MSITDKKILILIIRSIFTDLLNHYSTNKEKDFDSYNTFYFTNLLNHYSINEELVSCTKKVIRWHLWKNKNMKPTEN